MASAVDTSFPPEDEQVSKGDFRAQMLIISNEITALQRDTDLPNKIAFGDVAIATL